MAEPQALADLRETVDGFLGKCFDDVRVDEDGDFEVQLDGATTWVQLRTVDEDQTAVIVWSASIVGMDIDKELTQFLVTEGNNLAFGQFELHEDPPRIHISHALLGEFLSREELEVAVEAVAEASGHYGATVKERFGGVLPSELAAPVAVEFPVAEPVSAVTVDWSRIIQGVLGLGGVVAGALAAVYAYRQTSSWLLAAYAAVAVTNLIGRVTPHLLTTADKVQLALFLLLPPVVSTAILFLAYAASTSWWPAVLLACLAWIVGRAVTNAVFMTRSGQGILR